MKAAHGILMAAGHPHQHVVITDRPCGVEVFCAEARIPCRRIGYESTSQFSEAAKTHFEASGGVDFVLLFFTRRIGPELFGRYPVFNIHPSLLPAFPGLSPLKNALEAGVKYLGITLHVVTEEIDGGPIIAQGVAPIRQGYGQEELGRMSFLQKVYMTLLVAELLGNGSVSWDASARAVRFTRDLPASPRFNPAMSDPKLVSGYQALVEREGAMLGW